MPNYPFQRAKPAGWALYEPLTSAQANQIDANAAQAADGLVWTDVAAFRNWTAPQTLANSVFSAIHLSNADTWVAMGVAATLPLNYPLFGSSGQFLTGTATTSATALTPRKRAAGYNPVGSVALFGGSPGASSNKKYVRVVGSVAGAASMATVASSQTNTGAVDCLAWAPTLGLWIAGLDPTSNGIVETSPDALTFTARAVPNTDPRCDIAVGPAGVVITANVLTNKVIHSTNGINWFERTLPGATQIWKNVVYVPLLDKYVAIATGFAAIAFSSDAINWTAQSFTAPINASFTANDGMAVAFGRTIFAITRHVLFGNIGLLSQDGGASWTYAASFPTSSNSFLATSGKQILYGDGTSIYLSFGGGF